MIIDVARERGMSAYVGDGSNRWPAVHRLDAASLFRHAVEQAPKGTVLHGVGEEGVPVREIAEVIGRHLELPVVSVSAAQAPEHFGFLGAFLGADSPASSALTRAHFGWQPAQTGLIDDLERGHYFEVAPVGR
jgi:nucleoside-diphosphate-sugar epimerase